jgi:hypothetical protein
MAHPRCSRAEVRFCADAATPSSDMPTVIGTWKTPPAKAGFKSSSRNGQAIGQVVGQSPGPSGRFRGASGSLPELWSKSSIGVGATRDEFGWTDDTALNFMRVYEMSKFQTLKI